MRAPNHPTRVMLALASLALLVAACGSAASPSPAATPEPTTTPTATATPEPTDDATASPGSGDGPNLEGAAGALEDLTSYQLDMIVAGLLPTASGSSQITMEAIVDRENEAAQVTMSGFEGLPTAGSGLGLIIVGDDAWIDITGTGAYIPQPGGAGTFGSILDQLSPAALLTDIPTESLEAMTRVGDETKNGVSTVHYHATGDEIPEMAAELGSESVADVWIAADGGYLVSMVLSGTTDVDGTPTEIEVSLDISRLNDPSIDIRPPG